jgi:WD40 repeat protein
VLCWLFLPEQRNSVSVIDVPSLPSCSGCRVLAVMNYSYEINDIAFAHSGSRGLLALTTGKGSVEIVDVDAAISSRATPAASSSSAPVQLSNPSPLCSLENHSAAVYCLSLSSDGRLLGSGGADAVVCVRETASLTPLCLLSRLDSPIRCLSFSHPSLSLIAVGGEDGQLELSALDAATGSRVWLTQLSSELNSLAFHPSLPLLAYATDSKDKCSVTLFGVG